MHGLAFRNPVIQSWIEQGYSFECINDYNGVAISMYKDGKSVSESLSLTDLVDDTNEVATAVRIRKTLLELKHRLDIGM